MAVQLILCGNADLGARFVCFIMLGINILDAIFVTPFQFLVFKSLDKAVLGANC